MRTTRPLRPVLALLCTAAFLLTACGDGEAAVPASDAVDTTVAPADDVVDLSDKEFEDLTGQSEVAVTARDNTFAPGYIEISVGTTVTFTNRGRNQHNVLPANEGAFEPIEVEDLEPGTSASLTFDEPGDYPYYCSLHGTKTKGMVGAIRVVA
jgi:plastocyanin